MKLSLKALSLALLTIVCINKPNIAKADNIGLSEFGICDHLANYTDQNVACDEIIASGIKYVRIDTAWASLSQSKGTYNATNLTRLDDIVNRLSAGGVQVVLILDYTALWASSVPGDIFAKPADWADWEDFVNFIVSRYNNKVTHWEVWNEPDWGFWHNSIEDYVTLLQKAAVQIRAVNPNNKILMGGLACGDGGYGLGSFFDTMLSLGAGSSFDIINYHFYGTSIRSRKVYAGMKAVIDKYSLQSRKIWVTETGYSTGGDTTLEQAKANYLEGMYYTLFDLSPNIERAFLYVHRNPVVAGDPVQSNFGLCANDRTPLLPFYHYQAINGAETNFKMQKSYPATEFRRTLNYVVTTGGDGAYVVDYAADGSSKRIPAGRYMYLKLNDAWMYNILPQDQPIYVDVTYLNTGNGAWRLDYDGASNNYQSFQKTKTNTGAWLTQTFTLTDAKFANRQNYSADFRIDALNDDLIVQSVVVRRDTSKGWAVLATTDQSWLMWRINSNNVNLEAYNPVATIGGTTCRQILGNTKYIYFDVAEELIRATDTRVTFTVTFWDAGTDNLLLQYSAIGNTYKAAYIKKTNTNAWRTCQVAVTDANFADAQNNSADFRISNAGDSSVEYISDVGVKLTP